MTNLIIGGSKDLSARIRNIGGHQEGSGTAVDSVDVGVDIGVGAGVGRGLAMVVLMENEQIETLIRRLVTRNSQ